MRDQLPDYTRSGLMAASEEEMKRRHIEQVMAGMGVNPVNSQNAYRYRNIPLLGLVAEEKTQPVRKRWWQFWKHASPP